MAKHHELIELAEKLLKHPESTIQADQIENLRALLRSDDLNAWYFLALYLRKDSKTTPKTTKDSLWIYEDNKSTHHKLVAYPSAIAPPEMLVQLPYIEHKQLLKAQEQYRSKAQTATLWIKKMQAGSGTSLTRGSYLSNTQTANTQMVQLQNHPAERREKVRIGAKGTDLFIRVPKNSEICLAEAQILQAIQDARAHKFKTIILHDLVSTQTESSIYDIWNKKSLIEPTLTYHELIEQLSKEGIIRRSGKSIQALIPTLDENHHFSFNRVAPGGHALFALDALRAAYVEGALPDVHHSTLISCIGNGEDLSSTPDQVMVGWMIEEKIPIAMVTTEKTANDLKGGQIALVQQGTNSTYVTIIEQAQAKESGQEELFKQLGLEVRNNDQIAFFNTNMALFNYDVLQPKLTKLIEEIGETEFLKIVAPDLILNTKEQTDQDGVCRKYTQLEGAMGSCLLNLDRYWRLQYQEPLVHFINVDRNTRTHFFSPIKTAFDYFMQFHSDLFELDFEQMRLIDRRPGKLPSITLKDPQTNDKFYQDVQNVLESFEGTSIINLDSLEVHGQVSLGQTEFRGNVRIHNQRKEKFDLTGYFSKNTGIVPYENGRFVLENLSIDIDQRVEVVGGPFSNTSPNR